MDRPWAVSELSNRMDVEPRRTIVSDLSEMPAFHRLLVQP